MLCRLAFARERHRRMRPTEPLHLVALAAWISAFTAASHIDEAYLNQDANATQQQCGTFVNSSAVAAGDDANERTLASPLYPGHYPNATRCVRLLRAPSPYQRVVLKFVAFDVEGSRKCSYDSLLLRDGPYGFSPEIARLCGSELPLTVRSTGQHLLAIFSSDEHVSARGFLARYEYEHVRQEEGMRLGEPCYIDVLLQGGQGEAVINRTAVAKHYSNHSGRLPAIDCVWDIRSSEAESMVLMWIHKAEQAPVSDCQDRVIQIYAPKMTTKLFDIDTPVASACYQGEDRVYPGSSRILVHIYAKSLDLLPRIEFNHTLYTPALSGGTCAEGLFDCEDGRVCVRRSLLCNGYENCPSGLDESRKHCAARRIHENKWLQLIFLMAALCGLLFVTGVLACAASQRLREGRIMRLRVPGRGGGAARPPPQFGRCRSSEDDASDDSGRCRAIVVPYDGEEQADADKRRAAFYGSWTKSSVDSSHAA